MAANKPLRILHLEDDPDYSKLVRDILMGEGLDIELVLVSSRPEYEAALASGEYDLILGDFSLPAYNGLQALAAAREKLPHTPFLLVSGTIGEQAAIESLREGATDYVLKQWPERLAPAVRRAVREARERTWRREAESALVRREKYFRALTDNSLDVVSILDGNGAFQYNSPSMKRVLGHAPPDLIGRSAFELVHPEDLARVQDRFAFGLAHPEQAVTLELRMRHHDGSWVHLEAVGQSCLDDPDIAGVVVNSRDITERKRVEHRHGVLSSLSHSLSSITTPEEAAAIIRGVADQLFAWDSFTLDLHVAEKNQMRPVLNVDTLNGQRVNIETPGGLHAASRLARRIMERGSELILRDEPKQPLPDTLPFGDKQRPSASLMYTPVRNGPKVIGVLSLQSYTPQAYSQRDLETLQILADHCGGALERVHAEQAMRESEERFRDLFASSPDAIFVEDLDGTVLDVNQAGCQLHGLPRNQLVGRNVIDLVPAEHRREVAEDFRRLVEGETTRVEGESVASDGRVTPVEIRATRIDYGGRPAVLLHVRDISERKHTESALRSSEMLFHSVWENSVDGMRLTDEHGLIVAVNEAFCKLVGLSRAELEGNPFTVIYAGSEQPDRILKKYQQRFADRVIERQIERRLTLRSGSVVVLEDTNSFVELRGQPPLLLGLFRDVTAQKRLEDQLRQSQKMDAIGQLAGGVAHDFNNILTVIHGHASLLTAGGLVGTAGRSAQQIAQAAERAAGLTRQLLTFSRRQVMQPRRLDLNEVTGNMTKMLSRILGEDVTLQMDHWPVPAPVRADSSMMEQVILNLAVNARDAMPRGGQLNIRVSVEEVTPFQLKEHAEARVGSFVCLTASDTGTGIAPEILRRIFEPFFTTKEVGKGTGLGLATVYGIVKQHQGWVEVESEMGHGTTFRVYLPLGMEGAEKTEERKTDIIVRGGHETILVVEDEPAVRELVSSLLQSQGYKVLEAETGVHALEMWKEHKDKIALLLTDVVMPDRINGRELADRLWAERPNLKVIFTSGYSADVVGRDWILRRGFNYVQKPYQPYRLAMVVRECLDAAELTPAV